MTPQLIGTERYNVEDGDDDQAKDIKPISIGLSKCNEELYKFDADFKLPAKISQLIAANKSFPLALGVESIRAQLPHHVHEYFSSRSVPRLISSSSYVESRHDSGLSMTDSETSESKKETVEDIQKRILDDYKQTNKINLGHRLSLLRNELSSYLNVEYSFDQVARAIHREKRTNVDFSYWSAKLLQSNVGVENQSTKSADIVANLEYAAQNGHQNAKVEMSRIKTKFRKGQYASLVESYTLAKREIVTEWAEQNEFANRARNLQKQRSCPLEVASYERISSDPKF